MLQGNVAVEQDGGAAFIAARGSGTSVQIVHSKFANNIAQRANAGALYLLLGTNATAQVVNVSMSENMAATSGGGAILDIREGGTLSVKSLATTRNSARNGNGGAVQLHVQTGGRAVFSGCSFDVNTAASCGGAMLVDSSCGANVTLVDMSMASNQAGTSGGSLYVSFVLKQQGGGPSVGSLFGSPPAAFNASASTCDRNPLDGRVLILRVTLQDNFAGRHGGGIFLAPASAATFRNLQMTDNTACGIGGSLAAEACMSLVLLRSTINNSRAMMVGGGLAANGCQRVLLQDVNVTDNKAFISGGGVAVSGQGGGPLDRQDVMMTASSTSIVVPTANTLTFSYTSLILHKVRFFENSVAAPATMPPVDLIRTCPERSAASLPTRSNSGTGGALFIDGNVAAVLSQADLSQPNWAVFGSRLASTQRCYANAHLPTSETFGKARRLQSFPRSLLLLVACCREGMLVDVVNSLEMV